MAIYLVRHGQSTGNAGGFLQGSLDYELSELGTQQAEALGNWLAGRGLQPAVIHTSPLKRARTTAEILATALGAAAPQPREELREYFAGELQGISYEQMVERFPQHAARTLEERGEFKPYGGESRAEMHARLKKFIAAVQDNHVQDDILVVGHGGCLYQLICLWCGWPTPNHIFTHLSNCCCMKLQLREVSGHTAAEIQWFVPLEIHSPELYLAMSSAERRVE